MKESHVYIHTLLDSIKRVKGWPPKVELHVVHGFPSRPETRAIVTARGFVPPGGPDDPLAPHAPAGQPATPTPPPDGADGQLRIGEYVQVRARAALSGYLHLYNLGTSGHCALLAPKEEFPDNFVAAGEEFNVPSGKFLDARFLQGGLLVVGPPPSALRGEPERFLFIVTRRDVELPVKALHPKLSEQPFMTARAAGFGGPPRVAQSDLFAMPPEDWEYGLLEMEAVE